MTGSITSAGQLLLVHFSHQVFNMSLLSYSCWLVCFSTTPHRQIRCAKRPQVGGDMFVKILDHPFLCYTRYMTGTSVSLEQIRGHLRFRSCLRRLGPRCIGINHETLREEAGFDKTSVANDV